MSVFEHGKYPSAGCSSKAAHLVTAIRRGRTSAFGRELPVITASESMIAIGEHLRKHLIQCGHRNFYWSQFASSKLCTFSARL